MIQKLIDELSLQSGKTNVRLRGHLYTAVKRSKEVESTIFVIGSFLHNYIYLDLANSMLERTKHKKSLYSQLLYYFKLLCIGGQRNLKFVWPLWLLSVFLSSFHLESSLFRLTIFRTLSVTLLIKVRMHVEPSLNITVDIVQFTQRFFS